MCPGYWGRPQEEAACHIFLHEGCGPPLAWCLSPFEGIALVGHLAFLQPLHSPHPRGGEETGRRGRKAEQTEPSHLLAPASWEWAAHLLFCSPNSALRLPILELSIRTSICPQIGAGPPNTTFTSNNDGLFGFHLPCAFVLLRSLAQHLGMWELTYWASSSPNGCVIPSLWFARLFLTHLLKNHNKHKYSSSQPFSQF